MPIPYRLGLDIGTNSLGWCALDLDRKGEPHGIRRMGVRIFSDGRDPQSGASLAQNRREKRSGRRRRDRFVDRRTGLINALVRHGLMPADKDARKQLEQLDPYELRARGLDESLPLHHFGRALFHLDQRRGFKSNRKTDKQADADKAKEVAGMKEAIGILDRSIRDAGCRTLGEYLYKTARQGRTVRGSKDGRVQAMLTVRARPHTVKGRNAYDFYPSRDMYRHEFRELWHRQAAFHSELTDVGRGEIEDIIFFQRPLKPVDPGKCALDPTDKRAPLALPIVQRFRILQELANLRLEDPLAQTTRRLTLAERDKLYAELKAKEKMTFAGMRRLLKLDSNIKINLEDARRPELKGDFVSKRLADDACFGSAWFSLTEDRQTEIIEFLLDEPEEDKVVESATLAWNLAGEQARKVSAVPLPDGYGRVGLKALRKIVPIMEGEADKDGGPVHYSEAAARAGYDHSERRTGEIFDEMPYYGEVLEHYVADVKSANASEDEREHGRIANPTVHIGLNQLRKLTNKLIKEYGKPAEIVVELARELKLNQEEKDRIKKEQAANKKRNDAWREEIERIPQARNRGDALLRMRLWSELSDNPLERQCVYTNEPISIERLFSDAVEIDHILPFQESLDDNPANLTVCMRRANRDKRKQSPYDAFHDHADYAWDEIIKRSTSLPPNKRWRFRPDAMELVRDRAARDLERAKGQLSKEQLEDIERAGGFLARHLVDTAYAARVARQYLWTACENPNKVWVIPGRLTGFLRRKWGLNKLLYGNRPDPEGDEAPGTIPKRRDDHRHHAIDAFVIGVTDPAMLQKVSTAAARAQERTIEDMPEPWDNFRHDLQDRLDRLIVSYKPDHGRRDGADGSHMTTGRLHTETAYGIVDDGTGVFRKPIDNLNSNEIDRVRDLRLREKLKEYLGALLFDESMLDTAKEALKQARRQRDEAASKQAQTEINRLKALKKSSRKAAAKDLKTALAEFGRKHGIRRVRLLWPEAGLIPINDASGKPYKAVSPGDNHRVEIFERADGNWGAEIVTVFDANRSGFTPRWQQNHPGTRHVATFFKNDLIKLLVDGRERIMRVVSIWERYLQLAGHTDTNLAERYRTGEFKWTFANYEKLKESKARKVTVDILGRVRDPGPPS